MGIGIGDVVVESTTSESTGLESESELTESESESTDFQFKSL